ncbi:MAG: hypothetical protein A2X49_08310 [Lentisphaerae bacterium GWF2_52_8]|nr:MAG: hypothetical protein A2X49_08310 [Lentisphaerae bacterium GWF2_52_8]
MASRSVRIPEDKFIEHVYHYMGQYVSVERRIASALTEHQEIELLWNSYLGNILVIDGIIQHTDRDEFVYAELFAHVPLACVNTPAPRVLIVGGGDFGLLEEILKHPGLEFCDLVEQDGKVIEFAKEHMKHVHHECWRDPRISVSVMDGLDFLRGTQRLYDVILVDGTDPGYPEMDNTLFTDSFFELARQRIAPGGIFVIGSDVPFHHPQAVAPIQRRLRRLYSCSGAYQGCIPTFQGGITLFAYGLDRDKLPDFASVKLPPALRYLNPETLRASFALPEYLRKLVDLEEIPPYEWRAEEYQ